MNLSIKPNSCKDIPLSMCCERKWEESLHLIIFDPSSGSKKINFQPALKNIYGFRIFNVVEANGVQPYTTGFGIVSSTLSAFINKPPTVNGSETRPFIVFDFYDRSKETNHRSPRFSHRTPTTLTSIDIELTIFGGAVLPPAPGSLLFVFLGLFTDQGSCCK